MEHTLDELVAAVASRLTAAGLDRQANGQVSAFPDRRTLRYYTTIGLMDRPDSVRDRQARYSDRHVTQAVAVKRLQASGLALAAIQGRLAGLPLDEVEAIAAGNTEAPVAAGAVRRFWAQPPSPVVASTGDAIRAAAHSPIPPAAGAAPPLPAAASEAGASDPGFSDARPMVAIPLTTGATLLLTTNGPLTAADVAAIRGAASTLLDHLDHLPATAPISPTAVDLHRKDPQ